MMRIATMWLLASFTLMSAGSSSTQTSTSQPASAPTIPPEQVQAVRQHRALDAYYKLICDHIACPNGRFLPVSSEMLELLESIRRGVRIQLRIAIRDKEGTTRIAKLRKLASASPAELLGCEYAPQLTGFHLGAIGRMPVVRVIQVIDDDNIIVSHHSGGILGTTVWCSKWQTAGLTDSRLWQPPGYGHVTGTRRYATADGATNTVFVAEPVPIESLAGG